MVKGGRLLRSFQTANQRKTREAVAPVFLARWEFCLDSPTTLPMALADRGFPISSAKRVAAWWKTSATLGPEVKISRSGIRAVLVGVREEAGSEGFGCLYCLFYGEVP